MSTKETTRKRKPTQGTRRPKAASAPARKAPVRRSRSASAPDVVYTQPGPFNKERFVLYLLTVTAVVLALLFGMSIFFKTDRDKILVSGTEKYTAYDVWKVCGIKDGENLLTIREAEVGGRILEALPYVKQVRVGIKLPDTVNIEIEETEVVYSMEASDGTWWLVRGDGKVVDNTNPADAQRHTVIKGVRLAAPVIGEQAVAEEQEPEETTEAGQQTPVTVLGSERLEVLLSILGYMESNSIIGDIASIDVTNPNNLELWHGKRFQVVLGDSTNLDYKLKSMKAAMEQMESYSSGMLDVSFTLKETEVIYTPFE